MPDEPTQTCAERRLVAKRVLAKTAVPASARESNAQLVELYEEKLSGFAKPSEPGRES